MEAAGFLPLSVQDGPDIEVLQQATMADVAGKFVDRNTVLAPDVRLRCHEFVEGMLRTSLRTSLDFTLVMDSLRDGRPEATPPTSYPSRIPHHPLTLAPRRLAAAPCNWESSLRALLGQAYAPGACGRHNNMSRPAAYGRKDENPQALDPPVPTAHLVANRTQGRELTRI